MSASLTAAAEGISANARFSEVDGFCNKRTKHCGLSSVGKKVLSGFTSFLKRRDALRLTRRWRHVFNVPPLHQYSKNIL